MQTISTNNANTTNAVNNINNGVGGIYNTNTTVNTVNTNILTDVGNHNITNNWNSNRNGGSSSGSQKRGAERLFQYMEADGSDPEDYAR